MSKNKKRRGRPKVDGPREANGRPLRTATRADREKAMMAVVESRCRAVGIWPEPVVQVAGEPAECFEARKSARIAMIRAASAFVGLPWMGSKAGRKIAGCEDVADLWQIITMIQGRYRAHQRAIDAPRQIATMALMVAPTRGAAGNTVDPVEADFRSDEERAASSIAAWAALAIPDDLLHAVVDDEFPAVYPLATKLREVGRKLDSAYPEPVAKGMGHSLAEVAARAWVIECSLTLPGGKTERQVRVVEDGAALRDEAVKALAGVMKGAR